jgi:ubiquinone/menaquinone biosynthesis C-methylase UbiE
MFLGYLGEMGKADYSRIAASYDKGRPISEQNIDLWMGLIAKYSGVWECPRVLDLGCGTGRFALPMASRLHYRVTGADYSREMLAKASDKDTDRIVEWDYQDAQTLTYQDESFDVVFISHLLHHVDSPQRVIRECQRVLVPSGVIVIRYGAIEQIRDDVEHTFFPETLAIDEARTPTIDIVEEWLKDAGFTCITTEENLQHTYETAAAHLEAVRLKSTSVLTMISPDAFEQGMYRMSEYVKENPDDPWLLFDRFALTVGYK